MDGKSAFLKSVINEEVYVSQPPVFVNFEKPNHVFKLKEALYGLKQAPKDWYDRLKAFLLDHKYIKGITHLGLWYPKGTGVETIVYADSDHAGDYLDRKSTSDVCTFIGCCLTSWLSKKQTSLAISTIEAEYVSAEKAFQQALWMKQALVEYYIKLDDIPVLCDNKCAIDLSKNPVLYLRTKHIEIRHHFLRDNVQKENISIEKSIIADLVFIDHVSVSLDHAPSSPQQDIVITNATTETTASEVVAPHLLKRRFRMEVIEYDVETLQARVDVTELGADILQLALGDAGAKIVDLRARLTFDFCTAAKLRVSVSRSYVVGCTFVCYILTTPPRRMNQNTVERLVANRVAEAIAEYKRNQANPAGARGNARGARGNAGGARGNAGGARGNAGGARGNAGGARGNAGGVGGNTIGNAAPKVRGCTYKIFLACNPYLFSGTEGIVGLSIWFEKMESVFQIIKCANEDRVKYVVCTLHGRALTWWNGYVHSLEIDAANQIPWNELKDMITVEYCLRTEAKAAKLSDSNKRNWKEQQRGTTTTITNITTPIITTEPKTRAVE
nr:copia protein [Tanacetum cinerariifolium]